MTRTQLQPRATRFFKRLRKCYFALLAEWNADWFLPGRVVARIGFPVLDGSDYFFDTRRSQKRDSELLIFTQDAKEEMLQADFPVLACCCQRMTHCPFLLEPGGERMTNVFECELAR
jgi:hypothetical protein